MTTPSHVDSTAMSPWLTIWMRPAETLNTIRKSRSRSWHKAVPYIMWTGLWYLDELPFHDIEPSLVDSWGFGLIFSIAGAFLLRYCWVLLIFLGGKIWNGKGSWDDIDAVISLALIPYILPLIQFIGSAMIKGGDIAAESPNPLLLIICTFISIRILLMGLSRVQKFTYGIAILNVIIPQIVLLILRALASMFFT